MNIVGIVGSNAEYSYNRLLLNEIKNRYQHLFSMEIIEIVGLPLFNQSDNQTNSSIIQSINSKIKEADGIIIATPEINNTITPALKSLLEWMSFELHPFEEKPVMILGASLDKLGTSRSQLHLRQILEAPGLRAHVFPGNEFLLGNAKEAFNENGNLIETRTIEYLSECIEKFVRFVRVLSDVNQKIQPNKIITHREFQIGNVENDLSTKSNSEQVKDLLDGVESSPKISYHTKNGKVVVKIFQVVEKEEQQQSELEEYTIDFTLLLNEYLKQTNQVILKSYDDAKAESSLDIRLNSSLSKRNLESTSEAKIPEWQIDASSSATKNVDDLVIKIESNHVQSVDGASSATKHPSEPQPLKEDINTIQAIDSSSGATKHPSDSSSIKVDKNTISAIDASSGATKNANGSEYIKVDNKPIQPIGTPHGTAKSTVELENIKDEEKSVQIIDATTSASKND